MKTNDECPLSGSVIGAPLVWLRMEGVFVFILSILFYARTEASWWLFLTMLWAPDLSIAGYWLGARVGAVAYNVAHSYVGPVALAGVVVVVAASHQALLSYCLIWMAHIGMDRALGYGLKYPDAFKSTHLGTLGVGRRP